MSTAVINAALEPCKAGFTGCDAMRAEAMRKHPRTPRLWECKDMPIPPERPERLQGPEVGTLCLYSSRYQIVPMVVRVVERSYVWAPGDPAYHGGSRRYDWKVIDRGPKGKLCVDDKDLVEIDAAQLAASGTSTDLGTV